MAKSLSELAVDVLTTADPDKKTKKSRAHASLWFSNGVHEIGGASPPLRPSRPERPELRDPKDVPKRGPGTLEGRAALLHAIAHIELNAVDLHWDIIARFSDTKMPKGFYDDWVKAADEEAKHFQLLSEVLATMGFAYGDYAAHAGMWRAAEDTKDDLFARLAIVPMVLEARGLDVTPGMITLFERHGPEIAVAALKTIYAEEVGHVAYGSKWFHFLCGRDALDPKPEFHTLVKRYFPGGLKPPFNDEKRAEAGLPLDFYWPMAS
ncbi:MAG: ferritin-like domain-containing protein [Pseudomonadota bacterium]